MNDDFFTKYQKCDSINPLKYYSIQNNSSGSNTLKTTSYTFVETEKPNYDRKTASLIDYDSKRNHTAYHGYDTDGRVNIKDMKVFVGNDEDCKIKCVKEENSQNQNYDKAPFLSYSYISENNNSKEELFESFFETPKRKSFENAI